MNRARLLVFNAALGPLDYRVPDGMEVQTGSVVLAPLGPRQITGIVWDPERLPTDPVPEHKLRPLIGDTCHVNFDRGNDLALPLGYEGYLTSGFFDPVNDPNARGVIDLDLEIPGDPRDLAPEVCLHVGVVQEQNVVSMPFGPPRLGLPHT